MLDLLDTLITRLDGSPDNRGRWHADCPFCGAPAQTRRGRGHAFHFYLYDLSGGRGAVCWSCGWRGSLGMLARELRIQGEDTAPRREVRTRPDPPWFGRTWGEWQAYHRERQAAIAREWRHYKPLQPETIRAHGLSVAPLVFWDDVRRQWRRGRHNRLIVPLRQDNRIVGFRGRAYLPHDDGPKWLTASSSELVLMGLDQVQPGSTVVWCENLVDRLLAAEREPKAVYLASGGLTWHDAWLDDLARRRPAHVLIWFDHDLSGNSSPVHHDTWIAAWRDEMQRRRDTNPRLAERPFPAPPQPRGPKLANELLARGVRASVYRWPAFTPRGADLGWALLQEYAYAA
jgi:hypothetical protein